MWKGCIGILGYNWNCLQFPTSLLMQMTRIYIARRRDLGVLKKNEAKLFTLLSDLRNCELGNIVLGKNTLLNGVVKKNGITSLNKFQVNILSWRDGRGGLVDITSRLCRLVKTAEVKSCEIDQDLVGSLIQSEVNIPDPDLAIYCGKTCSTFGLLPWQIRVTEFLHLPTHHNINVKEFVSLLDRFGCCEQRFGKGSRDLSFNSLRGGKNNSIPDVKPRKVYTPNLNVQRNKNKNDIKVESGSPTRGKNFQNRGRGEYRGRGRGRANTLIQSSGGVFSEGAVGEQKGIRERGGQRNESTGGREAKFLPKPKLNLQHSLKFDKEEEDLKLSELLRDNFIDDPTLQPDLSNSPVQLPVLKIVKLKKELKDENEVEKPKNEIYVGGVKIKQEKKENFDIEQKDIKPLKKEGDVSEFFENKEPQLLLLQLPDCLPGLKPDDQAVRGPARPSTVAKTSTENPPEAEEMNCTLHTLPEGLLGKVQILKSGRVRILMGENVLYVEKGTDISFKQDLVAVDLDEGTHGGKMISLGPVKARLICSPDWENMLEKSQI
uniref:Uncharacterized protein n=1 Tax=Timema tahoe TaxID=61484 RepID=A0A7R9IAW7_9NEOP|nr:unnamed protein product [Timema tahoe]